MPNDLASVAKLAYRYQNKKVLFLHENGSGKLKMNHGGPEKQFLSP